MRAYAYPAEDPSSLKGTSSLLNYYLWFFSTESENIDIRYIKYNIPSS